MQNSLSFAVLQLIVGAVLSLLVISLLMLVPAMIYRKGRPEAPELKWTGYVCLAAGAIVAIGMFDMYLKNGGSSGVFAFVTIAVAALYWGGLWWWAHRADGKASPRHAHTHRSRHARAHRARLNAVSHR